MTHRDVAQQWPAVRRVAIGKVLASAIVEDIALTLQPMLHHGFPVDAAPFGYSVLYVAAAHGNLERKGTGTLAMARRPTWGEGPAGR